TVYIPTFNRLELLQRAVESVCNQTYKNLEIIVVDDCSTDGTQEYLVKLSKEDERVHYFLKEKNSGACVSRNIAIENAKGEFITGLDDDDYFLKDRIQIFVENKDKLENYEFLYSNYYIKNNEGLQDFRSNRFKPNEIKSKDLLSINYVNNQIFTLTSRLRKIGFNESLPAWQDLFTWYSFLENNKKALMIDEKSYVMDISHDFERISNKKIEKFLKAYDIFSDNHQLNSFERKVLFCQLMPYELKYKKNYYVFLSLLNSFNIYSLLVFKNRFFK
ncbi:MAG: glycosyltransferase, partial [Bacilli bacterium]